MSEFVEFTSNAALNRVQIDRITSALQSAYHGRIFSVTHEIDAGKGMVTLNISLPPGLEQRTRKNFQLGRYQFPFRAGVNVEDIVDHFRSAIEQLEERER